MPAAIAMSMLLIASPALTAASDAGSVPVPKLTWEACPAPEKSAASTVGFECAMAEVPISYADASMGKFNLALIKAPARDAAQRRGTLFWNPGGPSDAGTEYLPASIHGFPDKVRDRFDIISWDPRGMGGRTMPVVQCFNSADDEAAFFARIMPGGFPVTAEQLIKDAAGRTELNQACVERNGELLAYVSTADNARDLDLLRQAVGEETMNYYGTSYGTFLGATYINMYPDRVRAVVLDGAVAAPAWSGNEGDDLSLSTFIRLGSDFGSRSTIEAFMNQCGAVDASACAFSAGSPEATRAKWVDLLQRAENGIQFQGDMIDAPSILAYVGSSIYVVEPLPGFGRFPGWVAVAEFLQQVWMASEGGGQQAAADGSDGSGSSGASAAVPAKPASGTYITSAGRQLSVICGESPNPTTEAAAVQQALASYQRASISAWPFVAYCVGWTQAPYLGPWNKTTVPVLVIGNTYDPATALPSSVRMAEALGNARLLIVNGFGHTVLINPSTCPQDYIATYFIDGKMPPMGATCGQDKAPFHGG
ncbi:MAG: alpha/beta hydrolase [Gammaproteobacteria bacterium]